MINCDIIIPVFNQYDDLKKCLESVQKHTDLQNNRLIIIDDMSDDERIIPFIDDFISEDKQSMVFIKNECNLGYIKTVNTGLKFSKNDVLLLDCDTEVTGGWVDKMQSCAYSKERIATVTPLSNNSGIISVSAYNKANGITSGYNLDEYQSFIDGIAYRDYVDIPKGACFCLYINREALNTVGYFDEEFSGKYHDEENCFFYRCLDHGFRHVLCDDVIVYHGAARVIPDYYQQPSVEREKESEEKYSQYKIDTEKWELCHPVDYIKKNINLNICVNNGKSNVLIIIHIWEEIPGSYRTIGGTSLHAFDIIRKLSGKYNFHVLAPYNGMYRLYSYWGTGNETIDIFSLASQCYINDYFNSDYSIMLDEIIELFQIKIIHIHHMIGHYFDVIDVAKTGKAGIIISLHDYFSVCPRINKINSINLYCENADNMECDLCLASYVNENYGIKGIKDIAAWNKTWALLFSLADRIIAPSGTARDEVLKRYKNIAIDVIEHGIDNYCEKREMDIDTVKEYHIAFIGFITAIKGKDIIENLVMYSSQFNDNVYFHLFGYIDSKIINSNYGNFKYHGEYDRNKLNTLFIENNIKLVCNFSVWPEVFSYTLSESVLNNIPVLAIDLGAVGQRIKENNLGWLVKNGIAIPELYDKIKDIFNDKEEYKIISKYVKNYRSRNVEEMCNEYDKIYSGYKVNGNINIDREKMKIFIKKNYALSVKIRTLFESELYLKGEIKNKTIHIGQLIEGERYLKGELQNKTGHVEQLIISERQLKYTNDKLNIELNKILSSGTWKIVSKIFSIMNLMFPKNSWRRKFTKNILVFIKNPLKLIKGGIQK